MQTNGRGRKMRAGESKNFWRVQFVVLFLMKEKQEPTHITKRDTEYS